MIKYIIVFILFILFSLVSCDLNKCIKLKNDQKFGSHVGNYEFGFENYNITLKSINNKTFSIKIFNDDGQVVKFKTRRLEYVNKFSYVEIINTSLTDNEIEIYLNKIEVTKEVPKNNKFEEIFSHFSLFVMVTLLIFGDKSIYCKILLLIMIGIEICYYGNVYLGDKFRINILKIK